VLPAEEAPEEDIATNYERGRAFEYRTRDALTKKGAVYVMRAAGSHTKADLVAFFETAPGHFWKPEPAWLVQCKRDGRLPEADRTELVDIARRTGAKAYLAAAGKNGRGVTFTRLT
jgi:Holliday junction resolvase